MLGTLVHLSLTRFRRSLGKIFGRGFAQWHALLTVSQFHFMFYASRPLPNTFALVFVFLALNFWLEDKKFLFVLFSGVSVLIFRGELALLLGVVILMDLAVGRIGLGRLVGYGLVGLVLCLGLTVGVDSIFWKRTLWPEGEVLYFNVVLNKSGEWGTSPWPWYFYSAIPRALFLSVFLVPLGLVVDQRTVRIVFPAVVFVFLYSFLPHKELRFIIYVFPLLNVAAAAFCKWIWDRKSKSLFRGLLAVGIVLHVAGNVLFSSFMLKISADNYPGGVAMKALHEKVPTSENVHVHLDNLACQTGISRFLHLNEGQNGWKYDKTEGLKTTESLKFSHLIYEVPENGIDSEIAHNFQEIGAIEQFSGISLDYKAFPPLVLNREPALLIMKKR